MTPAVDVGRLGLAERLRTATKAAIEKRKEDEATRAASEFKELWSSFVSAAETAAGREKFDVAFSFVERGSNAVLQSAVEQFYARLEADKFTRTHVRCDGDLTTLRIGWGEPAPERTVTGGHSCACNQDACLACNPCEDPDQCGMSMRFCPTCKKRLEATNPMWAKVK